MNPSDSIVIIPTYNEKENIEKIIRAVFSLEKSFHILVIDDGSKDNTLSILRGLTDKYPKLLPLTKPNGGHGPTVLYGYRYAIDNGADLIFQTDSDGQTNPAEFEHFWEML